MTASCGSTDAHPRSIRHRRHALVLPGPRRDHDRRSATRGIADGGLAADTDTDTDTDAGRPAPEYPRPELGCDGVERRPTGGRMHVMSDERIEVPAHDPRRAGGHLQGADRSPGSRGDRQLRHVDRRRRRSGRRRSATGSSCTWTARRSTTSRWGSTTSPSRSRRSSPDREIAWTILGQIKPADRSRVRLHARADRRRHARHVVLRLVEHRPEVDARPNIFPIISEAALRATLGILDRTVRRSQAGASS